MRFLFFALVSLIFISKSFSQVTLDADGPGNTYNLITSVLAPGFNPIEVPDCSHNAFGDHINEVFDNELGINVFRFHIHVVPDDDRCIVFDRQRNEIKTYDKSPDNLLGVEDEIVIYKWKFKLPAGFQSSPNFTHIHQLKSVGGSFNSKPMYTLTTRKSTPDRIELRYAEVDTQITLLQTDLAPFIDEWLEVEETITYGVNGTYEITIKKVSDQSVLLTYNNNNIINWRVGAEFVRPKWGIYRSLINDQDLRDETVLFANFSIEELTNLSTNENTINDLFLNISTNPVVENLKIDNKSLLIDAINIYSMSGKLVLKKNNLSNQEEINLNVVHLNQGVFVVQAEGDNNLTAKKIVIQKN